MFSFNFGLCSCRTVDALDIDILMECASSCTHHGIQRLDPFNTIVAMCPRSRFPYYYMCSALGLYTASHAYVT